MVCITILINGKTISCRRYREFVSLSVSQAVLVSSTIVKDQSGYIYIEQVESVLNEIFESVMNESRRRKTIDDEVSNVKWELQTVLCTIHCVPRSV